MKKAFLILVLSFCYIGEAQVITFPDANLKASLILAEVDTNNNNQIEVSEALATTTLDMQSGSFSDLTGIGYFTNLTYLKISHNQVTSLVPLQSLTNLITLNCSHNLLTSITGIESLSNLQALYCTHNQLTSLLGIELSTALDQLDCSNNEFTTIDLATLPPTVNWINCSYNQLTTLDAGMHDSLSIDCSHNQISSIVLPTSDVSSLNVSFNLLTSLTINSNITVNLSCDYNLLTSLIINAQIGAVHCTNNLLTSLDLSNTNSPMCQWSENPLVSLFIKNGILDYAITSLPNTPTLQYICADESDFQTLQNYIDNYGLTNINYNSYCTFEPGGSFFIVAGNNSYDSDQNGCDTADPYLPNLKYHITNGSNASTMIADDSGTYSMPVQTGTYTIAPILENINYFNVSPPTLTVTFPTQTSPVIQNFCITANGLHPDLDILIMPVVPAVPGFDAHYSVIITNKGNVIQSGEIAFTFDDSRLDFISASTGPSSQAAGLLTWDYADLVPFETRQITVILNVNSPMETPAVNNGDLFSFTAAISGSEAEETPADNTNVLEQIVVGSYDPNDITCLEGATISPDMVGTYVHYLIRFENTGTFSATNVVIADLVDTTKFDITTVIPMYSSHNFTARTTNGNKAEFIFENINLPFDDANNDGYIAFKIKTKPTLVVGDTFSKLANIYFDYNFPILTNTATTTITSLATAKFTADTFTIHPNPAKNELHFSSTSGVEVQSLSIYNLLGQLVQSVSNGQPLDVIDVSALNTGNYFIKITSVNGISTEKFIKI